MLVEQLPIIGMDHGNAQLKTHTGFQCQSGFTTLHEEGIVQKGVLHYQDKYYAVGSERFALKSDKTQDEDSFILSLAGIAESLEKTMAHHGKATDIVLSVGLPLVSYGRMKERFRSYFIRDQIAFAYQGMDYRINIKECLVFPQSYSALLTRYSEFKELPDCNVVDIGGGTTDCFRMERGMLNIASCFSLPIVTIHLYNQVLQQTFAAGFHLTESQVQQMILGNQPMFQDAGIYTRVNETTNRFVEKLLAQIAEYGLELRLNPTVFVGGGSILLQAFLPQHSRQIGYHEVIDDAFSNALGFEMLAAQKMMKK